MMSDATQSFSVESISFFIILYKIWNVSNIIKCRYSEVADAVTFETK